MQRPVQTTSEKNDTLAKRLRFALNQTTYTQGAVATEIGCSLRQFQHWLSGNHEPKASAAAKLAVLLGISSDWLLGLSQDGGPAGESGRGPE